MATAAVPGERAVWALRLMIGWSFLGVITGGVRAETAAFWMMRSWKRGGCQHYTQRQTKAKATHEGGHSEHHPFEVWLKGFG
ncbi:MAG: hypothetical protein HKP37_10220 [Boseongicola sp.]|nr:hypothetical protein [Boseongicola sp.]